MKQPKSWQQVYRMTPRNPLTPSLDLPTLPPLRPPLPPQTLHPTNTWQCFVYSFRIPLSITYQFPFDRQLTIYPIRETPYCFHK